MTSVAACVDVGSTYTKLAVVDLADGGLLFTGEHPTTVGSDVLRGVDAVLAEAAGALPGVDLSVVYACSSAGGGLRLAVVGYELLVSAQAAQRVALTAGARVVHVAAGPLDAAGVRLLRQARPDVVLLVGGTDGGDEEVLRHNAARLAGARLAVPHVVAGNADVRDEVVAALEGAGRTVVSTGNVLPRIGELVAGPARAAIRDVFLRHVIGGKRLSRGGRFPALVRAATPDAVLTAVELLARHTVGDILVVDVGGATTDVYSALVPDDGATPEVAGTLWRSRSVEGDLGVRWSAPGVLAAARTEALLRADEAAPLAAAARARAVEPDLVDGDGEVDLRLATLAATVALRRHARGESVTTRGRDAGPRRGGRDLRDVRLVIGSGGVLRHAPAGSAVGVLDRTLRDHGGGWALPRAPQLVIDKRYVLAPAGLLAADHPRAAIDLLRRHLHWT